MSMKKAKLNFLKNQSGYIAIISAIVISVMLIGLAFVSSFTGYFARFNILDTEFKKKSLGLAEACAEIALLKLAANPTAFFSTADELNIDIGGETCDIVSKENNYPAPGQTTIKTRSVYQNSFSNIQLIATTDNLSIISYEELPNF